jgi:hypothetical protein
MHPLLALPHPRAFLQRPLTVALTRQTRQAVCAINEFIFLRCLWLVPKSKKLKKKKKRKRKVSNRRFVVHLKKKKKENVLKMYLKQTAKLVVALVKLSPRNIFYSECVILLWVAKHSVACIIKLL